MTKTIVATLLLAAVYAPSNAFTTPAFSTTAIKSSVKPIRKTESYNFRQNTLNMADVAIETEKADLPAPAMMDEGIFTFNKILIDTVYNIICFFYPVSGTKRDFARFYVLETVARVPYFAYLSVMHLRYVTYNYNRLT